MQVEQEEEFLTNTLQKRLEKVYERRGRQLLAWSWILTAMKLARERLVGKACDNKMDCFEGLKCI